MIIALAGGVGGAKLVHGLAAVLPPEALQVVVNTGDDFDHLGLRVCPDLDTVMYTLAGRANPETGWGLAGETWHFMEALQRLGGETWFRLGDQDLATHVRRTCRLAAGETLSQVTAQLCQSLGIAHPVAPMTNEPVRTMVHTADGELGFQDYFVRRQCAPEVLGLRYAGAAQARPSPALTQALRDPRLRAIVICPSNPYLSIAPLLALPGMRAQLRQAGVPVIAVSPIVGGAAIKGPAAKIMCELGLEVSALEVARHYSPLIDACVLDHADAALASAVNALGIAPLVTGTVMRSMPDRIQLAHEVLGFAEGMACP
ncbi:LPPG domain protein containing protein [Acidovorax delafieldii 2AN]|uniref:LPPG domain protein containing protein n=1 Tax=Acidovorax delafieldii 2AN TaxID=573060 RepID=C5TAX6_ACIDE|nr:2-phospho-L-lactate transferase [Acidovorax delafieldii]EER58376.1 LPPG domain protein containing protein [Acidovorax delafieldii 2AN]